MNYVYVVAVGAIIIMVIAAIISIYTMMRK